MPALASPAVPRRRFINGGVSGPPDLQLGWGELSRCASYSWKRLVFSNATVMVGAGDGDGKGYRRGDLERCNMRNVTVIHMLLI